MASQFTSWSRQPSLPCQGSPSFHSCGGAASVPLNGLTRGFSPALLKTVIKIEVNMLIRGVVAGHPVIAPNRISLTPSCADGIVDPGTIWVHSNPSL